MIQINNIEVDTTLNSIHILYKNLLNYTFELSVADTINLNINDKLTISINDLLVEIIVNYIYYDVKQQKYTIIGGRV